APSPAPASPAASRRVRSVTSAHDRRMPPATMHWRSGTAAAMVSCSAATLWSPGWRGAPGSLNRSRVPALQEQALDRPAQVPVLVVQSALGHAHALVAGQ